MTDTPTTQSRGIHNMATGSLTGDGTALTITLGFIPRRVTFHNVTDRESFEWVEGMAATTTLKTVAAGTRTADTGSAIVVNTDGTVTISATANVSAKAIVYVAEG